MSLHFIVDGYNLLMRASRFRAILDSGEMEQARLEFIRLLEQESPQGSLRNRVTVVFDGRSDVIGQWRQSQLERTIRVIFTQGETADDRILRWVEGEEHASQIVVVTDDRGLSYGVRQRGARVLSVKDFLMKKSRKRTHEKTAADQTPIDPEEARALTDELAKRWLGKKK